MGHKNKTSLNVNENQIKKNQDQISILFKNSRLPRNYFSRRYFFGHNQKKYKKQSLRQKIDKKKRGFIRDDVLLSKKIKPERDFLRKTRVGIKGHNRCRTEENPIAD